MPKPDNPCGFKTCCHNCKIVEQEDRPQMCVQLNCNHYTPCVECKNNRVLDPATKLCKSCTAELDAASAARLPTQQEEQRSKAALRLLNAEKAELDADERAGKSKRLSMSITAPGVPPSELSQNQVEYYNDRWKQYEGFYRSPAAYAICHHIILEEIELNYIQSEILDSRGELARELVKKKMDSIRTLSELMNQLPEKEATEESDDEKSLSMIYDAYCKEKEVLYKGGVSRRLTPEAVALIPVLPYKLDPAMILQRAGFTLEDAQQAANHFHSMSEDPDEILKFLGFKHKEEYAMPFEKPQLEMSEPEVTPDFEA